MLAICDLGSSKNFGGQCLRFAIGAPQLMTHLGEQCLRFAICVAHRLKKLRGTVLAMYDLGRSVYDKSYGGSACDLRFGQLTI